MDQITQVLAQLLGLAGHALWWGVLLGWLLCKNCATAQWLSFAKKRLCILPLLVAASGLAWLSRGLFADISVVGMGVAACLLFRLRIEAPNWLLLAWGCVGLVLYASALGFIKIDLYAAGFAPRALLVLLVLWIVLNGYISPLLAWVMVLALSLFMIHGMDSRNLWDYFIDPISWIVLIIALIRRLWVYARKRLGVISAAKCNL